MIWLIVIGGGALIAFALDFYGLGHPDRQRKVDVADRVPTLFVPGEFGTRYTFGHMLRRLPVDKQVVALVRQNGSVHLRGRLAFGPHVAVQVLFADKRVQPAAQLIGVKRVIAALQQQAPFAAINLVSHSMGGITTVLYTVSRPAVPVRALVTLAAPYNDTALATPGKVVNWPLGPAGPSQTTPVYEFFRAHVADLPATLQWLNVAGDLFNGSQHDGAVGVNSALSIRYLAQDHVARYAEVVIRGPRAAHSLLHENRLVDADVATFLWPLQLKA
ncbi:alpha/beta hydrolase [Lacticaseibacillus hegangensis]|uniref:Alpha/beta hydrolase n=1 Tax=Lacticaseibacillus hegangensis TaxID=2486010 RepID=A0ABW4CV19_9LACO|nr:alpha/beta hydrolase [Lacticaseibacillus hegangensis]